MTIETRRYYVCDYCDSSIKIDSQAASPKLPPGWSSASDFYGNSAECCRNPECQERLRSQVGLIGINRVYGALATK